MSSSSGHGQGKRNFLSRKLKEISWGRILRRKIRRQVIGAAKIFSALKRVLQRLKKISREAAARMERGRSSSRAQSSIAPSTAAGRKRFAPTPPLWLATDERRLGTRAVRPYELRFPDVARAGVLSHNYPARTKSSKIASAPTATCSAMMPASSIK